MAKTKLMSRNSYSWKKAQFYAAHQAPRAAIAAPLAQNIKTFFIEEQEAEGSK